MSTTPGPGNHGVSSSGHAGKVSRSSIRQRIGAQQHPYRLHPAHAGTIRPVHRQVLVPSVLSVIRSWSLTRKGGGMPRAWYQCTSAVSIQALQYASPAHTA
jgi:hypothetical protein